MSLRDWQQEDEWLAGLDEVLSGHEEASREAVRHIPTETRIEAEERSVSASRSSALKRQSVSNALSAFSLPKRLVERL